MSVWISCAEARPLRARRISYAAALAELYGVHRKEQGRLLREACLLVCAASDLGRLYVMARGGHGRRGPAGTVAGPRPSCGPRGPAREGIPLETWRQDCREEIAAARADRASVDPRLLELLQAPLDRWPSAGQLARAALELERCHAGLLALAQALVSEGDSQDAIAVLSSLLVEEPFEDLCAAVLESLALAFESAGETASSLASYEAAVGEPRCDPRVAVALLCLSLRCGDARRAEIAKRRLASLDLSVPGTRKRFRRALRLARDRWRRGAKRGLRGGPFAGPISGGLISRLARECGAAAEVARALI